jgi:hypothetical protein
MIPVAHHGNSGRAGLFLGLDDGDPLAPVALEAHVLIETTTGREGIALQIREALIIGLPFIGGTQEAHVAGLLDHEEVFDRLAFLLAAVVFLLVLGIGWTVDWSFRTIMPTRGDTGAPSVRLAANISANSSALRAGSKS